MPREEDGQDEVVAKLAEVAGMGGILMEEIVMKSMTRMVVIYLNMRVGKG